MMCLPAMRTALIGFLFLTGVSGVIKETIPDYLRECYNSSEITTRDNLYPFTITTLISLIRKLEDYFTMDMAILTPAILQRFRFDGVQRNPEIEWSDLANPFSPTGSEFRLYKFIFDKFMSDAQSIPNNTLNYVERCTLHYMLSSTIDPYDRNDNSDSCSRISKYSSSWGNIRFPRETPRVKNPDAEEFDPKVGPGDLGKQAGDYQQITNYHQESQCPLESGVVYDKYGTFSAGIVLAGIASGGRPQNVHIRDLMNPLKKSTFAFPSMPGRIGYGRPSFNRQGRYGSSGINTGAPGSAWPNNGPSSGWPNNRPSSGWPNNGASGGSWPDYGGDSTVDNRYAATMSGLLSSVSLLLGPTQMSGSKVGMSGGWNDTAVPKYYLIIDYVKNALSDAKLRGGLDGLYLAKQINQWSSSAPLKLSQVLGMYYSDRGLYGTNSRACNRREYVDKVMQNSDFVAKTIAFASVFQDYLPDTGTINAEGINSFVSASIDQAISYVGSSMPERCPTTSTQTKLSQRPAVDLNIVIDANYNFKDISRIVTYLVDNMEVNKYSSNISIISGFEGRVLVDSVQSPLDVYSNFTYRNYTSWAKGFDLDKLLSALRIRFQDKLRFDQLSNSGGGNGRVVLFIPQANANTNNKDYLIDKVKQFRVKVPDVKLIYLVNSKERFSSFAEDPDKDVFVLTFIDNMRQVLDPVIKRISETPKRLINPNCGPYWSGGWYSKVSVKGYLEKPEVHYYRIHPNYYYRDSNARITIINDDSSQTLTVCSSRTPIIANNSQNQQQTCDQLGARNSKDFSVKSGDCPNSYATKCDPWYFSVAVDSSPSTSIYNSCPDSDCKYPDMVKYSIEHQGLTCYSGAGRHFGFPILVLFLYIMNFL